MTQPPPVPDYASPTPPNPANHQAVRSLMIGVGIGAGVSLVVWILMWATIQNAMWLWLLLIVPAAKIGASVYLILRDRRAQFPKRRFIGIGLLVSIPLGALILLGTCFGVLPFRALTHG
jgi:hypothetical protein